MFFKGGFAAMQPIEELTPFQIPAEVVRSAMDLHGWSQADLAYVLGVDRTAISQVLAGKRGISPDLAKALAGAFGLPIETFAKIQAEWELRNAKDPDSSLVARAAVQSRYPLREMIKRGWLKDDKNIETNV